MESHNSTTDEWSDDAIYFANPLIADVNITQSGSTLIESKEVDGDTTDSDDIPLAQLGTKLKHTVRRKLIESGSEQEQDDSDADVNYVPTKEDMNSSDSEYEIMNKRKKQQRVSQVKSKHPKTEQTKKKAPENKSKKKVEAKKSRSVNLAKKVREKLIHLQNMRKKRTILSDTEKAKRISKKLHTIKTIVLKSHLSRLDTLLASNELYRVCITGDGNCFFQSVINSGNIEETHIELRAKVCDFMASEVDEYLLFCSSKDVHNKEQFLSQINELKCSGKWNLDIADIIPLATANCCKSTLRIYSSSISTPVFDIRPEEATERVVNLAYTAIKGQEHYDATKPISNSSPAKIDASNAAHSEGNNSKSAKETDTEINTSNDQSTPHKRASYKSPTKNLSSRKRRNNPEKWKRRVRKREKNEGKEYISVSGKVMPAKKLKEHTCSKCKYKCSEKFSEEQRREIFEMYYKLGNFERQRQFICDMVERVPTSRATKGKRKYSQKFNLVFNERKERVCRNFFMRTLDIGRKTIDYTLSKKKHGAYSGKDMRGKAPAVNKTDQEILDSIKSHIESFPRMESHYARKSSKKEYLSHDLNIKKMWELYKSECEKKGKPAAKESLYRKVFCENFNLAFYKPKKDQCSMCALYNRRKAAGTLAESFQQEYDTHQQNKEKAREEKMKDKERAKADQNLYVATFDLQAVLTTPCSLVSELYYSRKLCCYNLTIYSLSDKQVFCHIWDETQCKRGSCEIATCLLKKTLC